MNRYLILFFVAVILLACSVPAGVESLTATPAFSPTATSIAQSLPSLTLTVASWRMYHVPEGTYYVHALPSVNSAIVGVIGGEDVFAACGLDGWCELEGGWVKESCLFGKCLSRK